MATLLIIDDEASIREYFRTVLRDSEHVLLEAAAGAEGVELCARHSPDLVLLDVELPDQPGVEVFKRLRQIDVTLPVIFITGSGTTASAIEAMSLGAYDYLLKPIQPSDLREVVAKALEARRLTRALALVMETPEPETENMAGNALVGRCPAMHDVYKSIGRVATRDVTTLIRGESGTGKELVARAIYHFSRRSHAPFLAINCAAIPEALLESELFGHEKGAFTGAIQPRRGKFEQCDGGTLFLDEIGDMTPLTQTKVLRVLQEQRFERVGGNETIQTNVRIIAATNRNLEAMVSAGEFRSDLYYRLNVFTIHLPPLRERGDDIALLATTFLRWFCRELGKSRTDLSPETLEYLRRYRWPGNVRELQSVIKHALLQATGPVIVPEFLPNVVGLLQDATARKDPIHDTIDQLVDQRLTAGSHDLYSEWLALAERRFFARVLDHTGGKLSPAARLLGLHRTTLRTKLAALHMLPSQMSTASSQRT